MAVTRQKRKNKTNGIKARVKARYKKRRKASKHGKHEGRGAQFPT